jgi:hypothetical protein
VRSAAGTCYNQAKASRRYGTVRFDTGHSGTVRLGIVHLDTAYWGTVRSGIPGIAAGIHNTAAGCRACSRNTWGSYADGGDVVAAAAGTGEQREEEAASDEAPRDRRPYRRREHQLLPVYSAQPADGGYSSCRLGD